MTGEKIIDLTTSVETYMPMWPTAPLAEVKPVGIMSRDGYNIETIYSTTHTGTHMDAPYHFDEHGKSVDQIDLGRLVGDGYCIKVVSTNHEISKETIMKKWKAEYSGKIILLNTGWSKKRAFTREFLYDFPGLNMEAAEFLYKNGTSLVGIDTLGMDPYERTDFPVHKFLLGEGIPFIEDLSNLDALEEGVRYTIIALPLKLKGASGSPSRVIAILDD